jgi:hypothetical protein
MNQTGGGLRPETRDIIKRIRKTTKSTFAIHAAVPAMPKKPKAPAISAMIRKINAHVNIGIISFLRYDLFQQNPWVQFLTRSEMEEFFMMPEIRASKDISMG